jgi:putative ABC transport system permease protein
VSSARVGVLSSGTITAGRTFTPADANSDVAVVDSDYAKQNSLKAGSTVSVDSTNFTVIGIVFLPQGSATTGVFIPLAPAQKLSGMTSKVNTIYVSAASATEISTVAREISAVFPRATVTTSSDLATRSPDRFPAPPAWPATSARGWQSWPWSPRSCSQPC